MIAFFVLMLPPAEILLLIQVARLWGWGVVLLLLMAGFVLGSLLMRLRGKVFFKQAMAAANRQEMPTEALLGGIAWYVAGVLLMIPGFITDVLALLVLLPPVRRRVLERFAKQAEQSLVMMQRAQDGTASGGFATFRWPPQEQAPQEPGDVFEGEAHVVGEDPHEVTEAEKRLEKKTPPEGGA